MIKKLFLSILLTFAITIPVKCYAITNAFHSDLIVEEDKLDSEGYLKVKIKINSAYELNAISIILKYDKSKLVIDEIDDESKFDVSYNSEYDEESSYIAGSYNKGLAGDFIFCSIKFKKTESFSAGDIVIISLSEVKGNNDTMGLSKDLSVSISKGDDDLVTGPEDDSPDTNNSNNVNKNTEISEKTGNNNSVFDGDKDKEKIEVNDKAKKENRTQTINSIEKTQQEKFDELIQVKDTNKNNKKSKSIYIFIILSIFFLLLIYVVLKKKGK